MKPTLALKVRTAVQAGQTGPEAPGYYPGQYGWWWMQSGYIARPGRPLKEFTGWWLGGSPRFYYPMGAGGVGSEFGSPALGAGGDTGEGAIAPPAP